MKTYTIVAGVNGCGKSSLTGVLRTEIDNLGKIIDVDKITAACGGNLLEGDKKAVALIDECLEKEICFTQETTLSGKKLWIRSSVPLQRITISGFIMWAWIPWKRACCALKIASKRVDTILIPTR